MGIDPVTHRPRTDHLDILANLPRLLAAANNLGINPMNPWPEFNSLRPQFSDVTQLAKLQLMHNLLQVLNTPTNTTSPLPAMGTLPFQDYQLNEYLRHNIPQFDINVPNCLAPNNPAAHVMNSDFSNLGNNYHQPISMEDTKDNCPNVGTILSSDSLPALLPASPERRRSGINDDDQMGNKMKPNEIMSNNPSSTSTNFDAFGDQLMDDGASEAYWRDFIE